MAYALHIKREKASPPISIEEWQAAVESLENVRLCRVAHSSLNPNTGEVIELPTSVGDAEVFFAKKTAWIPVFTWFENQASFPAELFSHKSPSSVWSTAVVLAQKLDAVIVGDEGEKYDLRTGQAC